MNIKVDERVYIKDDNPSNSDLFIVVRKNGHQTPYLIVEGSENYILVNLHSGQTNYKGDSVDKLIDDYFNRKNDNKLNPITGYFFVKSYDAGINVKRTFGYVEIK